MAPYSGAMLAIVARSARGSSAAPGPKNSTSLPTTPSLRRVSVTVRTRSVAVTPSPRVPVKAHPDDLGNQQRHGLTEHGGLGLYAAHAPAEHAQAVDHGGMRIGAHHGVGIGLLYPGPVRIGGREHHARQALEVNLMHDAGVRGHDGQVAKGRLSPTQEGVTLPVARELDLVIARQCLAMALLVDLHRVVDNQLAWQQGIDAGGIAAHAARSIAHGSQIYDGGHPGKVLENYPGWHEGYLGGGLGLGRPARHRCDVGGGDALRHPRDAEGFPG